MLRSNLVIILFTFVCATLNAQTTYFVIDKESNELLPNVLILYGENSIYSNTEGSFVLPKQFSDGKITLDGLGYELKHISLSNIENNKISLTKEVQFLEAAILRGDPIAINKYKQKHSRKKHWIDGVNHYHGREHGIFIPKNDVNSDVRLTGLVIPIIKKNADWEKMTALIEKRPNKESYPVKNKKLGTSFLFRIQFYEMLADSTFEKLNYPIKDFIVKGKVFKYKLDYESEDILFPDNGLLISVLNMGPCDKNGKMLSIPRFVFKEFNGKIIKSINNIYDIPLIALHPNAQNDVLDYFHSRYNENSKWEIVTDGLYPRVVNGPMKQLGLGYELEIKYYK